MPINDPVFLSGDRFFIHQWISLTNDTGNSNPIERKQQPMEKNKLMPRKALNKAYLKVKPGRAQINTFRTNISNLLNQVSAEESEEFNKNLLSRFLRETYYHPDYFINTKGRNDLVIHNGKDAKSSVGVIIETKKSGKKTEMLAPDNLNTKAMQELLWYFLGERITGKNDEVKHLVATNVTEWFIFDAQLFDKLFAQDKALVKKFEAFRDKQLSSTSTDYFYREIAAPAIEANLDRLTYTHFRIGDYAKALRNDGEDNKLIPLFKILSPEHLLKLPFVNDSNTLDKRFYSELLHIIGLSETKQGGKKLIERKKQVERDIGSLLENTINQLDSLDKIGRMTDAKKFGDNYQERLFNVGLELCITWINRILFLKLLEAQVVRYHKNDKRYSFLNIQQVPRFGDLNALFFSVLARKPEDRNEYVKETFAHVPYLNSSLFEVSEIEDKTIVISNLLNERTIPIHPQTVLKNEAGKRLSGAMNTLEYLFAFLNAYDFASEGTEEIQEENKTLINASVLGLIFEKINGYKDGSFFTPGFITMYMCRETIRRAVLQKFKEIKGWECDDLATLYNKIDDTKEANGIVNSLKICDPAVGSGHFLVSALNEIIAIKHELKILRDRQGKRLKEYNIEVVNDELIITDEDGELFEYRPGNNESQRVQEAFFYEKQAIIEGCLFGVDINPNSVKICRLRLWIELLKHAYYNDDGQLETLPNIDINIKCGNSLVSRFALDADLKPALKKSKWSIEDYQVAVQSYRRARTGEEKHAMRRLIDDIKNSFSIQIHLNDPIKKRLDRLSNELYHRFTGHFLFDPEVGYGKNSEDPEKKREREQNKLEKEIEKLQEQINEKKGSEIFQNAFEWRFEFPEVLNDDGDFVGFDVMIGNPPYGVNFKKGNGETYERLFKTFNWRGESYVLFVERAVSVLKNQASFGFIIPDTLINLGFTETLREFILKETKIYELVLLPSSVFRDATVDTILLFFKKNITKEDYNSVNIQVKVFDKNKALKNLDNPDRSFLVESDYWFKANSFNLQSNKKEFEIIERIDSHFPSIENIAELFYGIKVYQIGKGLPAQTPVIRDSKPFTSTKKKTENWLPFFDGKDIGYYSLLWNNNNWLNYGPWLAEPRKPEIFEGEKILIRKITGKTLIAHYIPYTSYCNTLLFVLKLKPDKAIISYKALLGILNSRFIGWYFRKKFQITDEDTFPQIMIRDVKQFAVPNLKNEITEAIEEKVLFILRNKDTDPDTDTTKLEQDIDKLVYQLYDLTESEIQIIEIGVNQ